MTFISALQELWKRRVLVALAVTIAAAAALLAVYHVSLAPPSLGKDSSAEARGSSEILVDSARSPIAGSKRDLTGLIGRAGVFARLMAGGDIVNQIAREAGISPRQIDVAGPEPFPEEAPGISEASEALPYGLAFAEVPELPIVAVSTRAPSLEQARALAAAAPQALRGLIRSVQQRQGTPPSERVEVRVLGPAQAATIENGSGAKVGAAIFVGVLALELGLLFGIPRLVAGWRRGDLDDEQLLMAPDISEPPAIAPATAASIPTLVFPNGDEMRRPKPSRPTRREH